VKFRAEISGNFQQGLNYTLDCSDDGIVEKNFSNNGPGTLTIDSACTYQVAGIYTVSIYARQGNKFAKDWAEVYVETEPDPGAGGGGASGPLPEPETVPEKPFGEILESIIPDLPPLQAPITETLTTAYASLHTQFIKAVKGASEIFEQTGDSISHASQLAGGTALSLLKQSKTALLEFEKFVDQTRTSLDNKKAQTTSVAALVVAPAALALEYSVSAFGLVFQTKSFFDLWLMLIALMHGLFTQLGLRNRRRYWGTVYDSRTKQPLDPAIVELIDTKTNKVVQTSITDLLGRFGFLDKSGKYRIAVKKTNYTFPSKLITGETDGMFEKIYRGDYIEIKQGAGLLAPNIPMDAEAFDWNQASKQSLVKFHPVIENVVRFLLQSFFWAGFAVVVGFWLLQPSLLNTGFLGAYLLMSLIRKLIPHPHLWGKLERSAGSVEGLYLELNPATMPNVILGKTYSSQNGKFFLKSAPGEYKLHIKEIQGDKLITLASFDVRVNKEGVINQTFKL
jgi:hypothetical protein